MKEIRMHMETGGVHEGRSRSGARKIARMMSSGPIDLFKFVPIVRNRVGRRRREVGRRRGERVCTGSNSLRVHEKFVWSTRRTAMKSGETYSVR